MSHRRLRWTDEVEQPGRSTPIIRSQIIIGRILHSQQILEWGGCILVSAENELAWMAITVWLITNNNIGRHFIYACTPIKFGSIKSNRVIDECRRCWQLFISWNKRNNSNNPRIARSIIFTSLDLYVILIIMLLISWGFWLVPPISFITFALFIMKH
jgi:hypothetical protein